MQETCGSSIRERLAILETKMDIVIADVSSIDKKISSLAVWKIKVMVVVSTIATIITLIARCYI